MNAPTGKVDLSRIAKLLGIIGPDEYQEHCTESGYTYGEVLRAGGTDEEAERAEQEENADSFRRYHDALMHAADSVFGAHGLMLVPIGKTRLPWEFTIRPIKTWKDAAALIVETINGVGQFEFSSISEFTRSGPYTVRESVLRHLGWLPSRSEVYGDASARSMFERAMRY